MEIVSLRPLSRAEIRGRKPGFLKAAFDGRLVKPAEPMIGKGLIQPVPSWRLPQKRCGEEFHSHFNEMQIDSGPTEFTVGGNGTVGENYARCRRICQSYMKVEFHIS